jgi:hypothetical protein
MATTRMRWLPGWSHFFLNSTRVGRKPVAYRLGVGELAVDEHLGRATRRADGSDPGHADPAELEADAGPGHVGRAMAALR